MIAPALFVHGVTLVHGVSESQGVLETLLRIINRKAPRSPHPPRGVFLLPIGPVG
jgi:hypothetical protein